MVQTAAYENKGAKLEKSIEYLTYAMVLLFYTGKVFQVFTVLIDILFLALLYVRKERMFIEEHKKLIFAFSVLFIYFFIQSLFATDILAALKNSLGMIRFVILFFALWYVFDSKEKIKRLIYSVFLIITLLFIDASYQYFTGKDVFGHPSVHGFRLTAWDSKPKLSSFIAIFTGVVIASLLIVEKKWIAIVVLAALMMVIVFSGSKGPLLYSVISMIMILLFSAKYRKYLIPALLGIGIVIGIAIFTNEKIAMRFHQFQDPLSAKNTSGRNQIYETAIEILKEHPFLGVGTRNFREVFLKYYANVYEKKEDKNHYDNIYLTKPPIHTHSILLSFLVNWGLIGTLIFFYILYLIYREYVKDNEIALLASIGLLYCIAPFNFGNTIARSQWQFYIFLTLAFVVILGSYRQMQKNKG